MRIFAAAVVLVSITFFCAQGGYGQSAEDLKAIREEIKALKAGQAAIQKELQEIRKVVVTRQGEPQAPVPFKEAIVSIEGGNTKGSERARLALIEFSEYQ